MPLHSQQVNVSFLFLNVPTSNSSIVWSTCNIKQTDYCLYYFNQIIYNPEGKWTQLAELNQLVFLSLPLSLKMHSAGSSSLPSDEHLSMTFLLKHPLQSLRTKKMCSLERKETPTWLKHCISCQMALWHAGLLQELGDGWPLFWFSTFYPNTEQSLTPPRSKQEDRSVLSSHTVFMGALLMLLFLQLTVTP